MLYTLKIRLYPSEEQSAKLLKTIKLSAQMVVRAIGKVAESYSDKNKRDCQHTFKPHGAIVYVDRILTVKSIDTVSVLTLAKIATTSDGKYYSGAKVKNLRRRHFKLRQKLQT